jgi:hypothetical protein
MRYLLEIISQSSIQRDFTAKGLASSWKEARPDRPARTVEVEGNDDNIGTISAVIDPDKSTYQLVKMKIGKICNI